MSQNARKSSFAVCLLAVGALVAIPAVAQKSPVPQPIPVNVENTPNVNVANTPSVSVTNTPSVNVSNTPNVNVANTPTVTLSSGASVAVTSPPDGQGNPTPLATLEAVQIYAATCSIFFEGGVVGDCDFPAVSEGKELVVQEFDAFGDLEGGNLPYYITLQNTLALINYFTYMVTASGAGYTITTTHQETRLYVIQGTPLCRVGVLNSSNGVYTCNISGFLVVS